MSHVAARGVTAILSLGKAAALNVPCDVLRANNVANADVPAQFSQCCGGQADRDHSKKLWTPQ